MTGLFWQPGKRDLLFGKFNQVLNILGIPIPQPAGFRQRFAGLDQAGPGHCLSFTVFHFGKTQLQIDKRIMTVAIWQNPA